MRVSPCRADLRGPLPILDLRQVVAVLFDVVLVIDQRVARHLLQVGTAATRMWQAIDKFLHQMEMVVIGQRVGIPLAAGDREDRAKQVCARDDMVQRSARSRAVYDGSDHQVSPSWLCNHSIKPLTLVGTWRGDGYTA